MCHNLDVFIYLSILVGHICLAVSQGLHQRVNEHEFNGEGVLEKNAIKSLGWWYGTTLLEKNNKTSLVSKLSDL